MAKYGQTWWGQEWLNSLSNIDNSNRLPRGRAYAGNGSVKSIEFDKNIIRAKVQGSVRTPYSINIIVPLFSPNEKQILLDVITQNSLLLTKLLNRELTAELNAIAISKKINVFPKTWRDFGMKCSCPDSAVPCKHLAAILYVVANEIDKNPFVIFLLHGFDIIEDLKDKNISVSNQAVESIRHIDSLWHSVEKSHKFFIPDLKLFNDITFTNLKDIGEFIQALLPANPLFYNSDFKEYYRVVTKRLVKNFLKRKNIDKEFLSPYVAEFGEYESIRLIYENNKLIKINLFKDFEKNIFVSLSISDLFRMFSMLTDEHLATSSPVLNSVYLHFLFAQNLIEKSAFIPELLQTNKDSFCIRWIPALLSQEVMDVYQKLQAITPSDIFVQEQLKSNKQRDFVQSGEEPTLNLISLFLTYIVQFGSDIFKSKYPNTSDKINELFFLADEKSFDSFTEKQTPNTIQLWLKRLYLTNKNLIPVLKISEKKNEFLVEVLVEDKRIKLKEPLPLKDFLINKNYQNDKFAVLRDLSDLSGTYGDLHKIISSNGQNNLIYSSTSFVDILLNILPMLRMFGINILLPKTLKSLVYPKLSMTLKSKNPQTSVSFLTLDSVLSFDWGVAVGDEVISQKDFFAMVKGLSGIVKIKDQYILLNNDELKKIEKSLSNTPELNATQLLKAALTTEYEGAKISLTQQAIDVIKQLTQYDKVDLPEGVFATLRPYQLRGYEWLIKNTKVGFGSLIADDMGLGKTLQVICALLKFKQEGHFKKKKALVIVPTTLLTNWQKEIEKFAPDLIPFIYHGQSRKFEIGNYDIVLTTYGTLRSDLTILKKQKWHTLVIDEAQNIKNPGTLQTKAVKSISADVNIAMSGTPVENRLTEYWSIMDFTNRGYLGTLNSFTENFVKPIQYNRDLEKVDIFQKITSPFILRRLKTDKTIINDLPDKVENNQYCSLSSEQAAIYQNVVNNTMKQIETLDGIERRGLVLKLITSLKQVCNHPSQFLKQTDYNVELSGKAVMLFGILESIFTNQEKTLIFTQYKEMGEILASMIENQFKFKPLFLHGGISRKGRDELVEEFQNKRNARVFILSLKAGGTGLNLTAAANVIHYDLWWNPAVEAQATDRAYRIGQTKNVMVHRMITQGTFEERIDEMIHAKKDLANLTVSSGEKWIGEMSNSDLKELVSLQI